MHSPRCTSSPSWRKDVCPLHLRVLQGYSDASINAHKQDRGERGSATNSYSAHHPPSPLHGNWILQTLSGLGSPEMCVPHPAITGCTAQAYSSTRLCKSYPWVKKKHILLLLNNIL